MNSKELIDTILLAKADVAILKRKKRLLLEELHRQYLEGELDPRKRIKQLSEKVNKL
jgi:hypothetical protein